MGGGLSGGFFFSPSQARAAVSPQKRKSDGKNHGFFHFPSPPQPGLQERSPERGGGHVGSAARERLGGESPVGVWGAGARVGVGKL